MTKSKVLVIDDEPDIRELLTLTLSRMGLTCDAVSGFKQGIEHIKQNYYSLVLTDMRLPDGDGIEIVKFIQKYKPQMPVAVITAYGNVEGAVNTLKAGAFDYVSKPIDLKMLRDLVKTALSMQNPPTEKPDEDLLVGESLVMQQLRENIHKLARSQAPVFIQGASGVGKELVAQLIHVNGPRKDKPFIPVNCGAIPGELMESEFFGHKKGSFTGAISDKTGLFVAAHGGTLFLDEIAELPLAMQVKLLRAIQEKAIKPIGELYEVPVDVRILSASHKNLIEEVNAGAFRQDLYYRINVIELRVPTLMERLSDIPCLTEAILRKLSKNQNRNLVKINPSCFEILSRYHFPGNVRELENILERAMAMCEGEVIEPSDLHLPRTTITPAVAVPSTSTNLNGYLQDQEKELILDALEKTKWNRTAAAQLLGVSFRTLRYRLKKLGLD
ncbi:sigma-54-dependent Fis family transcriptional regulator [Legionella pneumophila]|uniref:sigma-54-dependent transcriptional regulator n=1 Tax=Legionella pneumophila TaxID=446 RepID=UPI000D7C700F|nr:sigma-54 dependent transcriptional regulator [Legionella pneumophila]PYB46810.1 sigma-54-dependent Fis family transcriptional regulator [Legionella pneumophila]PYB65453.1 sigma-54-dependent Fis family transcriptional regulator [Legionella pneumophila]TID69111.1 sigma-54-dependent Fis family transcriptional regulator [Legionella pneumophila]TIE45941.1 sigma-54-dependent Fis family transcriptional regulator [Legionella pneumophila]TIF60326.1 sigma-54-dependent Fis family transcriptional regul